MQKWHWSSLALNLVAVRTEGGPPGFERAVEKTRGPFLAPGLDTTSVRRAGGRLLECCLRPSRPKQCAKVCQKCAAPSAGARAVRQGSSRLALRAEVGASSAEDDALDGGFAGAAGFAGLGVDAVEALKGAGLAVGVAVVAEGAAAVAAGNLRRRQLIGGGQWVDAGGEEGFIDVDVAEARDQRLVEQGVFDGAGGFAEPAGELGGPKHERLGAEIFVGL